MTRNQFIKKYVMSPNAIHNEVISRMARQLSLDNYAEALSAILSRQEKTRNILVETPNLHWFLLKHKKALDVNGSIPIKNDKIFFIDSKLINGIRNEEADLGGYEHKHIIKFFSDNNMTTYKYHHRSKILEHSCLIFYLFFLR